MIRTRRLIFLALVLSVILAACQPRPAARPDEQSPANARANAAANAPANTLDPRLSLAVAPFSGASDQRQLLAGNMPQNNVIPEPDTLASLDAILQTALKPRPDRPERTIRAAGTVGSCINFVHRGLVPTRAENLRYWQQVGQCAKTQLLLVPVVLNWKDRSGSAGGTSDPAWVVLDLNLIDVATGTVLNRFHYDYQQRPLSDNLLEVGSFVRRRGQWVSAMDLAREGIERGVRELGL